MPQEIDVVIEPLHAGQRKILSESTRFNVLECGRRWGKSKFGTYLACHSAWQGQPVAWFAPTFKFLTPMWDAAKAILAPITTKPNEQERRLQLLSGGEFDFWSLDDPDAGRGRKYKRVIIDEAGSVRNLDRCWQESIRPTLTDLRGDAWFLGTPRGRNYFHQLFAKGESGEPDWKSWRRGTADNPFIPADEIEAARRDLPEHIFNQEYLGIPADDGGNPFGLLSIRHCTGPVSTKPAVVYGVDLAKSTDWTWILGLDESGCCCLSERWQADWGCTRARLLSIIKPQGIPTLCDSTGVGDPIVEDLQRQGANVTGFKFSQQSKQQLMELLAVKIHLEEIRFPEQVAAELECFEYEYTRSGVHYSAPEGMHDDGVCSLALAVWHTTNRPVYSAQLI